MKGIVIKLADQSFVIPIAHLDCVMRITPESIKTIQRKNIIFQDTLSLPFIRLHDVLEIPYHPEKSINNQFISVFIVNYNAIKLAFQVDDIENEHEIAVKKIGYPVVRIRNIVAATILGNGDLVPILNIRDLVIYAIKNGFVERQT